MPVPRLASSDVRRVVAQEVRLVRINLLWAYMGVMSTGRVGINVVPWCGRKGKRRNKFAERSAQKIRFMNLQDGVESSVEHAKF